MEEVTAGSATVQAASQTDGALLRQEQFLSPYYLIVGLVEHRVVVDSPFDPRIIILAQTNARLSALTAPLAPTKTDEEYGNDCEAKHKAAGSDDHAY